MVLLRGKVAHMQNKVQSTACYTAAAAAVVALNADLHSPLGKAKPKRRRTQIRVYGQSERVRKAPSIEGNDVDAVLGVYQVVKLLYFGAHNMLNYK